MPDMTVPGTHLQSLVDEWRFKADECYAESRKQTLRAEMYQLAARELERAMREESAKKAKP